MIYLGFTVEQMIKFLNQNCRSFVLVKNDVSEENGEFRLTAYSDEHGEYESFGCLSSVVTYAFKPFLAEATLEREKHKEKVDEILGGIFDSLRD